MYQIYWKGETHTGSYKDLCELMKGYIGVPIVRV